MEDSQHLLAVDPGETNPVIPLSAADFLYALARTPNPKRFDRFRQHLLDGKPRPARVRMVSRDVGHSTTVEAGHSQVEPAPMGAVTKPQPPLNVKYCQEPFVKGPDSLTLDHTIRVAQIALLNPAMDVGDQGEANGVTDGNGLPVELSPLYSEQRSLENDGESSMFVRADIILNRNEDEESDEISGTSLHHGHGTEASPELPIWSDFRELQSPSSGSDDDASRGERSCVETSMLDEIERVSLKSQQDLLLLPKNKLRRPSRNHVTKIITYGRQNPTEPQQPTRKNHMLQRLAVDELDFVLDGDLSNEACDPDAEMIRFDDAILDFSSFPFEGSGRARIGHRAGKVVNKRKPFGGQRQNVSKPNRTDLVKYKLPNDYGMSPTTKKRLKVSATCSDGFEGSESQPTGRTMPMRLPRHYPRVPRQKFAHVTELTLRSSRGMYMNTENPQVLQKESLQSDAITRFYHEGNGGLTDAFDPLIRQVPELLVDGNKTHGPSEYSQLGSLSLLPPPFRGNIHTKTATAEIAPPSANKPKRRVTFSDDVRVKVLQTLRMVSAPIAIASSCDSDESEQDTTDNEEDGTSSESPDEDESNEEDEWEMDNHHYSEDGKSNAEIDAKDEEGQLSVSSSKAPHQSLERTRDSFDVIEQGNAQDGLNLNGILVYWRSVCHDGTHLMGNTPHISYAKWTTKRGKAFITEKRRQRQQKTEEDPWRPRKSVSTRHLIEIDDDILDYPGGPTELSGDGGESRPFYSAGAGRWEFQSNDGHRPSRSQGPSERMEGLQKRKQSQASVELGDPNWSVPYGSEDEMSHSQTHHSDYSPTDLPGYVVAEYPKYLNRALSSFSSPSLGNFSLVRSKSLPLNYRFHSVDQQIQEDKIVGIFEIRPALKHTVSPPNQSLSQMQSIDSRALRRKVSTEVGTTPVRGRVHPLSFIPPFLRD